MDEKLSSAEINGRLEALLFVATRAVSTKALARGLQLSEEHLEQVLQELVHDLDAPSRGMRLRNLGGRWRLETKPEHAVAIAACDPALNIRPLSAQALETLAIVALRQPVSLAEIDAIRGVNSQATLETLEKRKLVAHAGQRPAGGRGSYWRTTREFLDQFGLESLDEIHAAGRLERMFGPTCGKLGNAETNSGQLSDSVDSNGPSQ